MEKLKIFQVATISNNKQTKAKKCLHFFQSATPKRIWAIYNQFQFRFSYLPVLLYISKYPASCFFILIKNQLILNKNKEIQSPLIWKVLIIISRAYTYSFVKLWYQFKLFYYCVLCDFYLQQFVTISFW